MMRILPTRRTVHTQAQVSSLGACDYHTTRPEPSTVPLRLHQLLHRVTICRLTSVCQPTATSSLHSVFAVRRLLFNNLYIRPIQGTRRLLSACSSTYATHLACTFHSWSPARFFCPHQHHSTHPHPRRHQPPCTTTSTSPQLLTITSHLNPQLLITTTPYHHHPHHHPHPRPLISFYTEPCH